MGVQRQRRVGIVGAGPGGLAAAMLLRQAGAEVTVYERHPAVGGRSATITAPGPDGDFRFDMGPTFFLYPRVLSDIFSACGYDLDREIELIRLDPQYHLVFEAGGEIQATGDMSRLAEEVARICPADAAALPRFMADNRAKLAAFRPILEAPFNGPRDLVRPHMLRSLKLMRPHRTVDSDLATYFSDERVRLAFSFQAKYLGMSPFKCPSLFTILSFMEYEFGVYHPRGGCGAVMTAMERIAREMGVQFQLAEPVQEILFEGRRATGVRTKAGPAQFDALVINADFAQTMTTLVPDRLRRRWTDRKLAGRRNSPAPPSCSISASRAICRTWPTTRSICPRITAATCRRSRRGWRRPASRRSTCKTPASPTRPGAAGLLDALYAGARRQPGRRRRSIGRPNRRSIVRSRCSGWSGWVSTTSRSASCSRRLLTPTDWEADLNVFRGATFNLAHSLRQMLHLPPAQPVRGFGRRLPGRRWHPSLAAGCR